MATVIPFRPQRPRTGAGDVVVGPALLYNGPTVPNPVATIAPRSGKPFRVGEWLVEPAINRLTRGQQTVRLELRAMEVLLCLVDRAGEVVPKNDLFDTVWRTQFVSDNTLQRRIAELRGAFDDDVGSPRYIETVRTRGYRLIAPIRAAEVPGDGGGTARFWLISDGSSIPLQPGATVLGRAADADIVIRSPKMSRRHARIVVGTDRCVIEDLGSTNGTRVNGERVTSQRVLVHGDRIRIGTRERIFQFVSSDPDAETVPSDSASSSADPGRQTTFRQSKEG